MLKVSGSSWYSLTISPPMGRARSAPSRADIVGMMVVVADIAETRAELSTVLPQAAAKRMSEHRVSPKSQRRIGSVAIFHDVSSGQ